MKIYKVTINELANTTYAIPSNLITPRQQIKVEYYASREKAEKHMEEVRNSITTLLGYDKYEVTLSTIEVIE